MQKSKTELALNSVISILFSTINVILRERSAGDFEMSGLPGRYGFKVCYLGDDAAGYH